MKPLETQTFVCLDCETTGLDANLDRIIEVGAVRFTINETLAQCESLIDPECLIPETSIAIHHITPGMVQGKPKIHEYLPQLLEFVGNDILIGHGIKFDVDIIAASAARANIPCKIQHNLYMDTLRLARHYGESPINSLEQLRKHFNIQEEGAHRAMNDAMVNMDVFKFLVKRYKTVEQIFEVLSRPVAMKIMPLGKHKGRPITEVPLQFLLWAANKDFDQDLLFSIRSEIKRRKKGNTFQQSNNPFNNL
jgi:DNA polymerase III subunit epsilon